MRLSIRTKFTLALLVISLLSTTVVGGLAYLLLMRKFADVAEHAAAQNFRQDVSAYLDTYGSWQAAQAHEKFPAFAARRRLALGLPLTSGPAVPDFELFCPREENVQLTPLATADSAPLPGEPLRRPPFLFYLFDADMRALLPLEPYAVGDAVLAERHARLLPIESKGKVVAYFSPEGQVNYSEFDLGYLASIREALIYGSGAAVVLTLVLGMALGNRLSAAVMRLTTAAQAMTQGELKQRIPVDSRDEVGVLTETFNRMSEALAQSQEQVRSQAVQLKELSVRDSLTGLHNRRFFDEQARSLFERAVRDQRLRGAAQIHRRTPVARNASGSESHHAPGGVR